MKAVSDVSVRRVQGLAGVRVGVDVVNRVVARLVAGEDTDPSQVVLERVLERVLDRLLVVVVLVQATGGVDVVRSVHLREPG